MTLSRRELFAAWASGLTLTAGLAAELFAADRLDYEVPGTFPVIQQVGNTCWATTGTMMYNWKNKSTLAVVDLMKKAGAPYADLYSKGAVLPFPQVPAYFAFLGLHAEAPASYPPSEIGKMLTKSGLLWATTMPGRASCRMLVHARIIRGIHGDGDAAATNITVVDPATGMGYFEKLSAFYQEFEQYAKSENACDPNEPLQPQLLHF